jgi:hypothetical protein
MNLMVKKPGGIIQIKNKLNEYHSIDLEVAKAHSSSESLPDASPSSSSTPASSM